ncbi:MAG TPA: 30S ribosome-binding factor RbfA [Thermodesulfobacteriota bacterium]|nr:30S ribosome-binding factor RbfA [Thermodesulfobacteriota bacterium]
MEGKRSDKVADLIQKEVSQMLLKSIKDPRIGFITITRVTVSEDCRFARVYYSVAGTQAERESSMKGLDSAKGYLRKELGRRIRLRYTPEITFQFDPSVEYAIHMEELIRNIHQEKERHGEEEGD